MLALFHETQPKGWFWWSKCSATQFIELYKYTYDYLVKTKGIHNIVRLMPYSGSPTASFYPGKARSTLRAVTPMAPIVPFTSCLSTSMGHRRVHDSARVARDGQRAATVDHVPHAAPWLLWNIWAGYEKSSTTPSPPSSPHTRAPTPSPGTKSRT